MAADRVPGVSVAVIHNGAIEWAQGFGVVQSGGAPVTVETLFQAGSISKPVSAMAALRLVQEGKLSLDSDVNQALTSWKIPPGASAAGAVVTLRELLTHTAGLTVRGFPGYAAGAPVPTLVQILNGEKPANTDPIRLEAAPGSHWKYSGGGYTVMQQLLIDVSHQQFSRLLRDTVLAPIGMTRSTYEQPLPIELRSGAATPYNSEGAPVEGGFHTYPEMAAAGVWTTPTDLARYAIEIQRSLRGEANHVLSAEMTKQMLVAGQGNYGLGLQIGGSPDNPYFMHGGINEGFENRLFTYQRTGDGAVVMTNARGGQHLADAVMRSIASVYGWPNFHPVVRTSIAVDAAVLATYVGVYELSPTLSIAITLENGQLMKQVTNQSKFPIFPESQSKFFLSRPSRNQTGISNALRPRPYGLFWMICRFTSARIFPQRGCKLNEPNGFEPLRRVHDRIIRVLWPINFAHKRQRSVRKGLKVVDAQLEFFRGANGQISHLVLHQDGHDMRGERKQ
jgi:CubicO group peptidase (beta-lactamase class C family)